MATDKLGEADEATPLIVAADQQHSYADDAEVIFSSGTSLGNGVRGAGHVGERLPYNHYTTIDWLQSLAKDNEVHDHSGFHSRGGIRDKLAELWDSAQGWVASFLIGLLTAVVASAVDVSVETVSDWKDGYCTRQPFLSRRACCSTRRDCEDWSSWSANFGSSYFIYVSIALMFGIISSSLTMTTKTNLPTAEDELEVKDSADDTPSPFTESTFGKTMYMAAGSGIPEIKTVLSGFVIPQLFELEVLVVKAVGATFAVATGMCLGKEGPFVHISACVGYLVTMFIPKYAKSPRKLRQMLSVACSAGLSVAFGAPIGGVLFSYEEISTYFPRQVLWRSCLCSMVASAVLKELNPTGTGKLVLFETNYGVNYDFVHYLVFIFLGICGGIFGGVFCRANFLWSKSFRQILLIKNSPVFEVAVVTLITALLQFPNRLIRETGDIVIQDLLVDCNDIDGNWICEQEAKTSGKGLYYAWLISGTFVKLLLTTITFGCKVPSGIIIPAMDGGALFGRLIGQVIPGISPGIFAMVGAAAFLAGVSRMTVSLAVIMFELTGEVNFIPPFMIAILTAKWVADCICAEGVYDLAQHIGGHPFLDPEHAISKVKKVRNSEGSATVELLLPPAATMEQITMSTDQSYRVSTSTLKTKLASLKARGLSDAGLVIVNEQGIFHGYIPQSELQHVLESIEKTHALQETDELHILDGLLSEHINRSPMSVSVNAPLEFAVEIFGKLGASYLIIVEEETAKVVGVVLKKRLLKFLDNLK